jgi:hypothetical protein
VHRYVGIRGITRLIAAARKSGHYVVFSWNVFLWKAIKSIALLAGELMSFY